MGYSGANGEPFPEVCPTGNVLTLETRHVVPHVLGVCPDRMVLDRGDRGGPVESEGGGRGQGDQPLPHRRAPKTAAAGSPHAAAGRLRFPVVRQRRLRAMRRDRHRPQDQPRRRGPIWRGRPLRGPSILDRLPRHEQLLCRARHGRNVAPLVGPGERVDRRQGPLAPDPVARRPFRPSRSPSPHSGAVQERQERVGTASLPVARAAVRRHVSLDESSGGHHAPHRFAGTRSLAPRVGRLGDAGRRARLAGGQRRGRRNGPGVGIEAGPGRPRGQDLPRRQRLSHVRRPPALGRVDRRLPHFRAGAATIGRRPRSPAGPVGDAVDAR